MSGWNYDSFYKNLSTLIKKFSAYNIPVELANLRKLESEIYSQISYNGKFNINAKEIIININHSISGTTPIAIKDFVIYFDHYLEIDSAKDYYKNDLIEKYAFDIHIVGYDEDAKEYNYAWHLDKNITSADPKYTHPYYHFQGGGQKLEGMHTGEILLIDFPRIPHPPMDLFLGLHFIINNFISSKDVPKKLNLLNDHDYQSIIIDSQKLMWDIYFKSFEVDCKHDDFNFRNVFPLYIH